MGSGESELHKAIIEAEKRRRERIEAAAIEFEFPDWTSTNAEAYGQSVLPKDALARFPFEAYLAITQLQRELQHNRVQAVAHEAIVFDDEQGSFRHSLPLLHNWIWWEQMPNAESDFWQTGYLEIAVPEKIGSLTFKARGRIRYFGVRFWPDGLPGGVDNPLPAPGISTNETILPASSSSVGGRPREAYWEDALIEMFDRLWHGTLTPTTQAEVERALADHISVLVGEKGKNPSERSVRERAKKLWKSWTKEGQ